MEINQNQESISLDDSNYAFLNQALPFERLIEKKPNKYELFRTKWKEFDVIGKIKLENKNRYLTRQYSISNCKGFDTETYKGKCRLLCSDNDVLYLPNISQHKLKW